MYGKGKEQLGFGGVGLEIQQGWGGRGKMRAFGKKIEGRLRHLTLFVTRTTAIFQSLKYTFSKVWGKKRTVFIRI